MSAPFCTLAALATALLYTHCESQRETRWEYVADIHVCGPRTDVDEARAEAQALIWSWYYNPTCGDPDSVACQTERIRARVEALEAGVSYHDVVATSPAGVAFVAPTRVRI